MSQLRTIALPAVLAAAIGLCGCGAGTALEPATASTPGQAQAVRSVVVGFGQAMASGDGAKACEMLDQDAQQQVLSNTSAETPSSSPTNACAAVLNQAAAQLTAQQRSTLAHLHVGQVTVTGESASIDPSQISGPAGSSWIESSQSSSAITLEQNGNDWLLENLG